MHCCGGCYVYPNCCSTGWFPTGRDRTVTGDRACPAFGRRDPPGARRRLHHDGEVRRVWTGAGICATPGVFDVEYEDAAAYLAKRQIVSEPLGLPSPTRSGAAGSPRSLPTTASWATSSSWHRTAAAACPAGSWAAWRRMWCAGRPSRSCSSALRKRPSPSWPRRIRSRHRVTRSSSRFSSQRARSGGAQMYQPSLK